MFLVNSRHRHFSAAPLSYDSFIFTKRSTPSPEVTGLFCRVPWPEFSRAPWYILPTHLCWFAVRFIWVKLRSFSWQHGLSSFWPFGLGIPPLLSNTDLPVSHAYTVTPAIPTAGLPILLRPSFAHPYKYWNINQLPIDYAFQPRLRDRLTLGRLALPRKPRVYGERVSHPFYRYLCQHKHFSSVQLALRLTFCQKRTLPYHM